LTPDASFCLAADGVKDGLHRRRRALGAILSAIRQLMHPTPPKRRPIGFTADLEKKS
jgi:hypothetical protein